jgi:hypothetical protein
MGSKGAWREFSWNWFYYLHLVQDLFDYLGLISLRLGDPFNV